MTRKEAIEKFGVDPPLSDAQLAMLPLILEPLSEKDMAWAREVAARYARGAYHFPKSTPDE